MTNPLSQPSLRALAVACVAAAALAATVAIATSASAATPPPSCKGSISFTVLHNDSSGGVTLPAGKYAVSSPNLGCKTASNYFTTFLNKYNNGIPGWKGKAIAKGWGTYTRNGSATQFTVKWSKASVPSLSGCSTSALKLSIGQANGSAGTTYYPLKFTNTGKTTCTLRGYPGVSAVTSSGQQIGNAASRIQSSYATVALAPGTGQSAFLGIVETGNFSASVCKPVNAAALKVFPPNSSKFLTLKMKFSTCSTKTASTTTLRIAALK